MTFNWTYSDNVTSSAVTSPTLWSLNYSIPEMTVVSAMLATMIAVTACGNALVCVSLVRFRSLRSVSNMLIGNLAVSDFLLAVVVLPLSTINECLGRWPLGYVACNVWLTVDVLCCTASIWNLCMIAVDRCIAIVYPLWYRNKRSVRHAAPYVAAVWIVSTAVSVPPSVLGWSDVYVVDDDSRAVYQCVLYQSPCYVLFSACASFFVPFTITVLLYVRIFTLLMSRMTVTKATLTTLTDVGRRNSRWKVSRCCHVVSGQSSGQLSDAAEHVQHCESVEMTGHACECQTSSPATLHLTVPSTIERAVTSSRHQQRGRLSADDQPRRRTDTSATVTEWRDRREVVVSVRMAVIVVVFGGMWLGFFVVYVLHGWCPSCQVPRQLDAFFFWLGYANSSVNPILYTIFNDDFRRAFRNILAMCHCPTNC